MEIKFTKEEEPTITRLLYVGIIHTNKTHNPADTPTYEEVQKFGKETLLKINFDLVCGFDEESNAGIQESDDYIQASKYIDENFVFKSVQLLVANTDLFTKYWETNISAHIRLK